MKSKQVGYVLMALIAVGVIGLLARVVTAGSDELVLSGILPLPREVVDNVTITSADRENEIEMIRIGEDWKVGNLDIFPLRLEQFWAAVGFIDGAQLVAVNPAHHERMGVATGQGKTIEFFMGRALQEQFILGNCNLAMKIPLCFIRRAGKDKVYGLPYPLPPVTEDDIFEPHRNSWRDPVVAALPRAEVESVTITYPDGQLTLKLGIEGEWVVATGDEELRADLLRVDQMLSFLQVIVASDFATDDEARGLRFDLPDALVRVVTKEGSEVPITSLRFIKRDDISYYLRTPTKAAVYILDAGRVNSLLAREGDLAAP